MVHKWVHWLQLLFPQRQNIKGQSEGFRSREQKPHVFMYADHKYVKSGLAEFMNFLYFFSQYIISHLSSYLCW